MIQMTKKYTVMHLLCAEVTHPDVNHHFVDAECVYTGETVKTQCSLNLTTLSSAERGSVCSYTGNVFVYYLRWCQSVRCDVWATGLCVYAHTVHNLIVLKYIEHAPSFTAQSLSGHFNQTGSAFKCFNCLFIIGASNIMRSHPQMKLLFITFLPRA